jgi:hypothetical protein
MSSDASPHEGKMTWPKGNNCDFLVLPVPSISPKVKQDALSFICGNSFYFDEKQLKKRPLVYGVEPSNLLVSKRIQLEALFKDASGNGTDDPKLVDYRRYQTPPNRQQSLMKCSAIAHIVASTQRVIDSQVHGYSMYRLSILYSLPNGNAQGLHVDDGRTKEEQEADDARID